MKIKILKSKNETTWYCNMINQVIDVKYDMKYQRRCFTGNDGVHNLYNDDIVITELPESFCVKRCDDIEKWKKYIQWLNKTYESEFDGNHWEYYGIWGNGFYCNDIPFGMKIHIDDMIKHIDYMESQQHIKGGEQFSKESQLIAKMDKILKEETNINTQKLSRKGLKEIHSVACPNWKDVLEHYGSRNPLEDYIELTQGEVDNMFGACTKDQLPIVSKYLKQNDGSINFDNLLGDGYKLNERQLIGKRVFGLFSYKSFYLDNKFDWKIQKDEFDELCLIPTKKK